MKLTERIFSPTPKFFKRVRNVSIALVATTTGILKAPIALPTMVTKVAGYLVVAGGVAATVSQTAVNCDDEPGV